MKVLLLNPMTSQSGNVVRDVLYGCWCSGKRIGGGTVPPFNLLIMATLLMKRGMDADFLDAQAQQIGPDEVGQDITRYDAVCMSTSTMTFKEDAKFLQGLKSKNPRLLTVVFGSHPTFMPQSSLAELGIDVIVRHEPEFIIGELLSRLATGQPIADMKGIGFRKSGEITINPPAPHDGDLEQLPFPDISLLPDGIDYFNPIVRRLPYITTSTSKGCPGKCTFCTAPFFDGPKYRSQSADYVLDELEYFASKGIKEVYFRDDTFFVNPERDHAICKGIIDRDIDITWLANARVNMISEETISLAKQAGCHTIKFGIESGSQDILDRIQKNYKIKQAYEVFRWLRKHGMNSHAHVMLGNPGETEETLHRTIEYVIELNPTTATFGICTPYPGTPLFDEVLEKCPELGDGTSSDLSKLHIKGLYNEYYTDISKEILRKSVRNAYNRFYLRPTYWFDTARAMIRSVDDIKRVSIAATNVLSFIFNRE